MLFKGPCSENVAIQDQALSATTIVVVYLARYG